MANKIRVAVIGCGKQAPKHISGLRTIPGVDIILMDSDASRAQALGEAEGLAWCCDLGDVINDHSVRVLDICTPTSSHAALIRVGVESGRDFICEKPLCENLDEAYALAQVVDRTSRVGMIGYIYRFAPIFEVGKSLFEHEHESQESGVLGDVVSASFRIGGRGSHQLWKHQRDKGGGAINEMLVHMVDLAIWYFGPVADAEVLACDLLRPTRSINGELQRVDAEDYVIVRLSMRMGVSVLCQADLITPAFSQHVEIQGSNGSFMGSIQPDMPSYVYCDRPVGKYESGKTELEFGATNLFEAQMREFIHAVSSNRQPSRSTVTDSILVMEAMDKIRRQVTL